MTENTEQEAREMLREESMLPSAKADPRSDTTRIRAPAGGREAASETISKLEAYLKLIDR